MNISSCFIFNEYAHYFSTHTIFETKFKLKMTSKTNKIYVTLFFDYKSEMFGTLKLPFIMMFIIKNELKGMSLPREIFITQKCKFNLSMNYFNMSLKF